MMRYYDPSANGSKSPPEPKLTSPLDPRMFVGSWGGWTLFQFVCVVFFSPPEKINLSLCIIVSGQVFPFEVYLNLRFVSNQFCWMSAYGTWLSNMLLET